MGVKYTKENKYVSSVQDAMYLWNLHGERYRNLVSEYNRLLDRKRELGMALHCISKKDLANYPEIEFLYIEDEVLAEEYLGDKTPKQISFLCREIENMVQTNYVYRTLCSRVDDFAAEIRKKLEPHKINYASGRVTMERTCKRTCKNED